MKRTLIWMWLTQRNGKGPVKYFGLPLIEWLLWAALLGCSLLGYWLLFRLLVTMGSWMLRY